jgi:hypothetical protein
MATSGGVLDGLEVTHSHFYVNPDAQPPTPGRGWRSFAAPAPTSRAI